MKFRTVAILSCITAGLLTTPVTQAEDRAPIISSAASNALQSMGKTLAAREFSFRDQTIREYLDADNQPLHIVHNATVVVRRPDRLLVDSVGDDGTTRVTYDGKNLSLYNKESNKYMTIPVPDKIDDMLMEASERLGVDFPLADFLTEAPDKAFLAGITSGSEVNSVLIDGVPCSHLFFTQPPGIELELWVGKKEPTVPLRLIVTYRSLPGEPRFIAELSDWNFTVHPTDADFTFRAPAGATKVEPGQEKAQ
jgi:hypothetical protein